MKDGQLYTAAATRGLPPDDRKTAGRLVVTNTDSNGSFSVEMSYTPYMDSESLTNHWTTELPSHSQINIWFACNHWPGGSRSSSTRIHHLSSSTHWEVAGIRIIEVITPWWASHRMLQHSCTTCYQSRYKTRGGVAAGYTPSYYNCAIVWRHMRCASKVEPSPGPGYEARLNRHPIRYP